MARRHAQGRVGVHREEQQRMTVRSEDQVSSVPSRTSARGGAAEVDAAHLVVSAGGRVVAAGRLGWACSARRVWTAEFADHRFYVCWDEVLQDDWGGLHAQPGRPFARMERSELAPLVEDLKRWIHSTGGEIPQASRG